MIDIVEASLDVTLNSPHGLVGRFTSSIYDIDDIHGGLAWVGSYENSIESIK